MIHKLISNEAAAKFAEQYNNLIKKVGKLALKICEGFGIPDHLVKAPIYTGYQEYYTVDATNGEHYDVKMRPKF